MNGSNLEVQIKLDGKDMKSDPLRIDKLNGQYSSFQVRPKQNN
jgi:hypothetical protein